MVSRRDAENRFFTKVTQNVEKYGWHAQYVFPTTEDPGPELLYSVGLTEKGMPELLMAGLHPDACHPIMCTMVERMRRGEKFEDGQVVLELANLPTVIKELPADKALDECMFILRQFYMRRGVAIPHEFRVHQIVWPDPRGLFPWDAGVDERYAKLQEVVVQWGERYLNQSTGTLQ